MTDADPLHELAAACGVDVEFDSWQGEHLTVADDTLRAVLHAMGRDASTPDACRAALEDLHAERHARSVPPYLVVRAGQRVALDTDDTTTIELEDGRTVAPSDDLPSGYHVLRGTDGTTCRLIVTPDVVPLPSRLRDSPGWGFAAQLYSVRSAASWGVGDLADLATLARWSATEQGADFVLVNPVHAGEVVPPMNPSPYLPTTRRYANPIYLRVEDVPEYAAVDDAARTSIAALAADARVDTPDGLLDRDRAWAAKREALELVHDVPLDPDRRAEFDAYVAREGRELQDFATWCALTETYGPDWHAWPAALRHPDDPAVHDVAASAADRVTFYAWLQWQLDQQLTATQRAATDAGMGVGVVHDVAVGVSPTGADAWARQDELALGVRVGAPPDAYSQTGQDWQQPPWRPDRLAALGYEPFRALFGTALRHAGGLRVDHVIGLFRLWWIPDGASPAAGTYVHYDHEAVLGILALEASRAGAVLVGEDLGNVEPWVRDYLRERGVFGTSILWFESADGAPLPPQRWRELCLASVTTHDLPPTAGYLAGDHIRLRHELGLLVGDLDDDLARDRAEHAAWLAVLREQGLLGDTDDPDEVVVALHRLLARAPSLLRCATLTDAVGDRRTQNQPGATESQYPSWRIPLSGPDGRPVLLDDVLRDPRVARLCAAVRGD